jgi:osmotically-inducible protein OsmY
MAMNNRYWDDNSHSYDNDWSRNRYNDSAENRNRSRNQNFGDAGYSSSYDRSRLEQDNYGYVGDRRRNYEYDHQYGLNRNSRNDNDRQGMQSNQYRNQMQSMSGNRDFESWNDRNRDYGNRSNSSFGNDYRNTGNTARDYNDRDNRSYRGGYMGTGGYNSDRNRDWWDRTKDEVSSWFGDDDAERRRDVDRVNGPHRGKGPKDYKRSEDRIREDVCDRLSEDDRVDASNVQVQIQNNEVILSGTVRSKEEKRRAEDLVEAVSGVRNVENRLRVSRDDDSSLFGGNTGSARTYGTDSTSSERGLNR